MIKRKDYDTNFYRTQAQKMYVANPKLTAKEIAVLLGISHASAAKYIQYIR